MSTVTLNNLKDELTEQLVILSKGRINDDIAKLIANKSVNSLDFENSALAHKGVNWYAKELIKSVKI
ncbi:MULTISPECIES: hypothetical protein [Bacillus]|uniref:hypothetical protein n=1 Tax=Bacillus TaxID=1386 RepID=UPI0012FE4A47|nr:MULTISPECIES: hypothetical protein [Bacillus]MCX2811415.1 hypothetical protein [Bacillus sp. ChL18]UUY37665.1 hypothetical protein NSY19_15165 [Bacillus velezensis]